METVRLAFRAMATRFELVLHGDDPAGLRAAGEEVQREIKRIEACCNYYNPSSELSKINREASTRNVRCSGLMMRLLLSSKEHFLATNERFDPSVAPALARWGLRNQHDKGRVPSDSVLEELRRHIGFEKVDLDQHTQTIRFHSEQVNIDLGGIAKGWALDEARVLLEESGVEHALLHGGTSTALAIGSNLGPDGDALPWKIGIEDPYEHGNPPVWLTTVSLHANALSVSGVHGKSFVNASGQESVEYGHIINPLSGKAISGRRLALAVGKSAAACDAWSTALLAAPEQSVPDNVMGTAFLKTDSGWTVTAGMTDTFHLSSDSFPPSDSPT